MSSLLSVSSLVPRMRAKPMECEWFVDAKNAAARGMPADGTIAAIVVGPRHIPSAARRITQRLGDHYNGSISVAEGDGARANWRIMRSGCSKSKRRARRSADQTVNESHWGLGLVP